ncbi:hypothetical protein [Arcobacter arenosus]|uniref:hypothetical protein n=1 Tax=Arcobacter arenosus TaxID=2576037 RepID=UPI003BAB24F9
MTIEIDEVLFNKVKKIVKGRNLSIYEQLENITPIISLPVDTLKQAREIKTKRVKQLIQETIKNLYSQNMKPTKYQIHKRTGIAYVTINKYYDEILQEFN